MYALATCTASIYRGSTEDDFGQDIDDDTTPLATGVLCRIGERGLTVQDTNTLTPRTLRDIRASVSYAVNVRQGDRLNDDTNGVRYVVVEIVKPQNPAYRGDQELQLRRVD